MKQRNPMRELNGIEAHIKKLHEATENIEVFIASAYSDINGHSEPCLGIRDRSNRGVTIDSIPWLIAGTAKHSTGSNINEIKYLSLFKVLTLENIYIELRAQALVYGCFVEIELGKRKIVSIEEADDRIFAKLEVM